MKTAAINTMSQHRRYRPPYIPYSHQLGVFQVVYDHLKDNGVMVINVGGGDDDRRLIDSLYATIATVFPPSTLPIF